MAKIMLVEDDNNLREIYEARLIAEGYEIVAAKDGEEALALAVKEKPDLIISDVMMPKISGFDMLDILRTTPETKNTKIIMMTALSQAEDKARADKLGADRYLVKSQVTLEDVANVAKEVLATDRGASTVTSTSSSVQPTAASTPTTVQAPTPSDNSVITSTQPQPVAQANVASAAASATQSQHDQTAIIDTPATPVTPVTVEPPQQDAPTMTPKDEPASESNSPAQATPAVDPVTPPSPDPQSPTEAAQTPNVVVNPSSSTEETVTIESSTIEDAIPQPSSEQVNEVDNDLTQTIKEEESTIDSQIDEFIATATSSEPEQPEQAPVSTTETDESQVINTEPKEVEHIEVVAAPPDATAAAADNAAKLADAVNDMLQKSSPTESETNNQEAPTPSAPDLPIVKEQSSITGKKVIQPINDLSAGGPDLNALLEKEQQKEATETPVVQETPQAEVTQQAPEQSSSTKENTEQTPASNIVISPEGEIKPGDTTEQTVFTPEIRTETAAQTPSEQTPPSTLQSDPNDPNNIAL